MTNENRSDGQLVAQAMQAAIDLSVTQLGDVNELANDFAIRFMEDHEDDLQVLYAVVRVMAAAISTFALDVADTIGVEANRRHEVAAEAIRRVINELPHSMRERD
jgi:hypothetical protein